jgi:hypothetical protein
LDNGRFAPGRKAEPRRDRRVSQALSLIRIGIELMTQKTLPADRAAPTPKPWDEMSEPERMAENSRRALERIRDTLELRVDPENPRVLAIVTNTALVTLSQKIKIDEAALSQRESRVATERERSLKALVQRLPARFRPMTDESEPASDGGQDLPAASEAAANPGSSPGEPR